jgi:CheY-like chemotaxis protein
VAEAANGVEAAASIARLAPDVAFLDIKMPGMSGLEVAQGIETDTRWCSSPPTTSSRSMLSSARRSTIWSSR